MFTKVENQALIAWDNHIRDCKKKPACVYDGEKCSNGVVLYAAWRKSIGAAPSTFEPIEKFVNADEGRSAGGN